LLCAGAGFLGASALTQEPVAADCRRLIGLYLLFAIKVVQQWEKVALLRLGRYVGLRGPGWFTWCRSSRPSAIHRSARARAQRYG
jgi:nicotinamide riboside transporter PnuC